jgi:spore maturation protein CgeB
MNILLVGPIHREYQFYFGERNTPFVKGQGQQSWVDALEKDHKVSVFRYTDSILVPNKIRVVLKEAFKKTFPLLFAKYRRIYDSYNYLFVDNYVKSLSLLHLAAKSKPDVIIISGGINEIFPEIFAYLKKKYHATVFLFSGINPLVGSSKTEKMLVKKQIVDSVIENDHGYATLWKKIGAKQTRVLPISAADTKLYKKVALTKSEKNTLASDVCFVGTLTKARQDLLKNVTAYNLKIWGEVDPLIGLDKALVPFYQGKAYAEQVVKIYNAAKIVLNFQPPDMKKGGNMRTFEIPATGAFQITDTIDDAWFEVGKEVVVFTDRTDLQEKIDYYLSHETKRQHIAAAGFARVLQDHTYEKHFEALLS